ncbi:MAG TPA: hypothetical protein VMT54_03590 [Candidatus Cybelea sp.]|nr:hypothetical protein [Candidatus Cybelea sp.]
MTKSKQQNRQTEHNEISEAALEHAAGGIIVVCKQAQNPAMCDGSVKPATFGIQPQGVLIGL